MWDICSRKAGEVVSVDTADNRLSPVKATAVYADLNLDDVSVTTKGDYNATSLAAHVNTDATNSLIVRTWLHRAGGLVFSRIV